MMTADSMTALSYIRVATHFVHHMLFNPCENSTIVKDPEKLNKPNFLCK